MAGKGYTVGIASETKAFKQGIDSGIIAPLEDAEKALTDLGKSKGPDQLERGLEDAQKESKQLAKETKKTADTIEQEYRQSYKKMKDSADDAYDKAGAGAQDFKRESVSTARESAASFSGEFDDVGDLVQETLANAFFGFGPVGAAAGLAAAAGLGIVFNELNKQKDAADELKSKMAGMYQAAVEEGRAYLDEAQILKEMQDIMWNPDRVGEYDKALGDSKALSLDISTVLAAQAGDTSAIRDVQERINALRADELGTLKELTAADLAVGNAGSLRLDYLTEAGSRYGDIGQAIEENNSKAREAVRIEEEFSSKQTAQIKRVTDASQARWDAEAAAIEKAKGILAEIPTEIKVKIIPDDTAVRNWRAPMLPPAQLEVQAKWGKRID